MTKIAIACQGGGSHCAFTAGVLARLLRRVRVDGHRLLVDDRYEIVGLSGTSGGAISAYLAWVDLLRMREGQGAPAVGQSAVERFWDSQKAQWTGVPPFDLASNLAAVAWSQLDGLVPLLSPSPNAFTAWAQTKLMRDVAQAAALGTSELAVQQGGIQPALLEGLRHAATDLPLLLIGAANVNDAVFAPFAATPTRPPSLDQIIASTALPDFFPPVAIKATVPPEAPCRNEDRWSYYWDGLLSQNPPMGDLLSPKAFDARPDEIWIVRINPAGRPPKDPSPAKPPPRLPVEIHDRRNELAGNLSLEQEKRFVRKINALRRDYPAMKQKYKHVALWGIALEGPSDVPERQGAEEGDWRMVDLRTQVGRTLDHASKLARDADFLDRLRARGEEAVDEFLRHRSVTALRRSPEAAE